MAHPLAKWAHEVHTAEEIPQIVRRALKVATTPPCGPVVLSVPMDLMEQPCAAAITPAHRSAPACGQIRTPSPRLPTSSPAPTHR